MKKDIFEKRIDKSMGDLDIDSSEIIKKNKKNKALKIGLPIGILGLATCVTLAIVLPLTLNKDDIKPITNNVIRYSKAKDKVSISKKSYEIYNSFYTSFTSYVFKDNCESSITYSPFDCFVNLALIAYSSSDATQEELLTLFGTNNINDVTVAVNELTYALGTPTYDSAKVESGAYSTNAIFLNPDEVTLSEDEESKKVITMVNNDYHASIFKSAPTTGNLYQWLLKSVPDEYRPLPSVKIPNGESLSLAVASSYFIKKYFNEEKKSTELENYKSKSHYLDYFIDSSSSKVDYLTLGSTSSKYCEGKNFTGYKSKGDGEDLGFSFYTSNNSDSYYESICEISKNDYKVSDKDVYVYTDVPYFNISNSLDLIPSLKNAGMKNIFDENNAGMLSKLIGEDNIYLTFMKQFSISRFDYNGFYQASVTVSAGDKGTEPTDEVHVSLDKPFIYVNSNSVNVDGNEMDLPISIGLIIEPGYPQYNV